MKNVTSLKSTNTNSPKTPGGISKSLLTPCRRVGLSRNWKKNGLSPFISPLSNASGEVKEEKTESRKRKERVPDENIEGSPIASIVKENIDNTPARNIEVPRRKKSKTLLAAINTSQEQETHNKECRDDICEEGQSNNVSKEIENVEVVTTPVRSNSKKSKSRLKISPKVPKNNSKLKPVGTDTGTPTVEDKQSEAVYTIKETSPNDLKKECVVVIQRKIFKNIKTDEVKDCKGDNSKNDYHSTDILDSDSDEAPLINIQKQNSVKSNCNIDDDDNDGDFIDNKQIHIKTSKLKDVKVKKKVLNDKITKTKAEKTLKDKPSSQNCFDDDDDDFDNKKTILIRKSYDKVSKPIKAKSTGSITQRDIDNIRARIESKKKLLLAQSMTPDTEELRSLIKKWQRGCQQALMELLDLMRSKFPDKEKMDYTEMLNTLKIPPSLVGYDSENDCFVSPDDTSIVLGELKDI